MKFIVMAQAFHPTTGAPLANSRAEEIDTKTNVLFRGCENVLQIKARYEQFWNGDPAAKCARTEIVFVQSVTPI